MARTVRVSAAASSQTGGTDFPPDAAARGDIRAAVIAEAARQGVLKKSIKALALIAEASLRPDDGDRGGYAVVDAAGDIRLHRDGETTRPVSLAELVAEIRATHPHFFRKTKRRDAGRAADEREAGDPEGLAGKAEVQPDAADLGADAIPGLEQSEIRDDAFVDAPSPGDGSEARDLSGEGVTRHSSPFPPEEGGGRTLPLDPRKGFRDRQVGLFGSPSRTAEREDRDAADPRDAAGHGPSLAPQAELPFLSPADPLPSLPFAVPLVVPVTPSAAEPVVQPTGLDHAGGPTPALRSAETPPDTAPIVLPVPPPAAAVSAAPIGPPAPAKAYPRSMRLGPPPVAGPAPRNAWLRLLYLAAFVSGLLAYSAVRHLT